jgi:deoxycytidine triphosphate deaminase
MALFTLIVDSQTEAFGGGRRSGERQQLHETLLAVAEALREAGQFSGDILDVNRAVGVDLEPREMVWILSKEEFALPKDVTGFATLRTTFTKQGILALNVGIIDPFLTGRSALP